MQKKDKAVKSESKSRGNVFYSLLILITSAGITGLACTLTGIDRIETVRNVILALMGAGGVTYLGAYAKIRNEYDYDNEYHPDRFFVVYHICLLVSFVLVFVPSGVWPFLPIFVALSLFSNSKIGILSGSVCLMISVLSGGVYTLGDFFVYFICGSAGVVMFQGLDETYKVTARSFVSMLVLLTGLSAQYVLLVNEVFSYQLFLLPAINLAVSFLLLMSLLKGFSGSVILRYRLRYLELNDTECPLLVDLKEKQREEYIRAVHTAYFCDRIAKKLKLDDSAARGGGFYHKIGLLKGDNSLENIEGICQEYSFPPRLKSLLLEYADESMKIHSKEAAVLLFSDSVVTTIRSLFQKEADAKPDYALLIDAIFQRNTTKGILNESDISVKELAVIRKIFLEETLYYDFLR